MKFAIGLVISFAVGVGCRYFDIPVGSPSVLPGALIVLAMTAGYSWTNQIMNGRNKVTTTTHLCGGPSGAATKAVRAPEGGGS
jgi:XapX domain-containing protein